MAERDEQTLEERQAIARRYRERRGGELRALASSATGTDVEAAGEFSGVPTEALAAIPLLGMFTVPWAKMRARRAGIPVTLLVAIDANEVHLLERTREDDRPIAKPWQSFPRGSVRVLSMRKGFMREVVELEVPERHDPLVLYAPTLRTNPWSAEVVRLLGGDAPEPLDLGD